MSVYLKNALAANQALSALESEADRLDDQLVEAMGNLDRDQMVVYNAAVALWLLGDRSDALSTVHQADAPVQAAFRLFKRHHEIEAEADEAEGLLTANLEFLAPDEMARFERSK